MWKLSFIFIGCLFFASCSDDSFEKKEFIAYEGPIVEVDSVTTLYSDSAVVRVKIKAPKQLEFENGDKEFPNTIFIEFYNPDGTLSSTLDAKTAYYTKETNTYKAEGDVEVIGYIEPQKMNSEELYWEPDKEEIHTDKFVRIETEDQISTGTGLVAKQDFSTYRILNPTGTIYLEDQSFGEDNTNDNSNKQNKNTNAANKKLIKTKPEQQVLDKKNTVQ
jgi:LPS export ABC transporter protein LptC